MDTPWLIGISIEELAEFTDFVPDALYDILTKLGIKQARMVEALGGMKLTFCIPDDAVYPMKLIFYFLATMQADAFGYDMLNKEFWLWWD